MRTQCSAWKRATIVGAMVLTGGFTTVLSPAPSAHADVCNRSYACKDIKNSVFVDNDFECNVKFILKKEFKFEKDFDPGKDFESEKDFNPGKDFDFKEVKLKNAAKCGNISIEKEKKQDDSDRDPSS